MTHFLNGTPATAITPVTWQKSAYSISNSACVETALLPGSDVAVRNSRDKSGPALVFTKDEMVAFVRGVKDGEFDHLVG